MDEQPSLENTGQCVMCGLCLSHCPTYLKTRNEAESPRGRIALMRAIHTHRLPLDRRLAGHLDNCLACRACEAVCPAQVPYGELIHAARYAIARARHRGLGLILSGPLLRHRALRRMLGALLRGYQGSGLQHLVRRTGALGPLGLRRLESFVPDPSHETIGPFATEPPGTAPAVALFTGCVAELFDRDTLAAGRRVLTRLGYRVYQPRRQTCCGAIHQHQGAPGRARTFMARNLRAFAGRGPVISCASGCGAQLAEYHKHLGSREAAAFSERHRDIAGFLAQQPWPEALRPQPLHARVAVHTPCSLRHVLGQADQPRALLARIPELELIELPEGCCGAAGSYMLSHPAMADALVRDQVQAIRAARARIVVTANIGCRLHLQAALRREGLDIQVIHPVTLLERQLHRGARVTLRLLKPRKLCDNRACPRNRSRRCDTTHL
jgi:glycolate oxidase iron-sulfur subunit